jgi:hypothetical protein
MLQIGEMSEGSLTLLKAVVRVSGTTTTPLFSAPPLHHQQGMQPAAWPTIVCCFVQSRLMRWFT